jgi:hypothetical protein
MFASAKVFRVDLVVENDIRIFPVLVEFEKQTDGTRRRERQPHPDVESKFSKSNYTLNLSHLTT